MSKLGFFLIVVTLAQVSGEINLGSRGFIWESAEFQVSTPTLENRFQEMGSTEKINLEYKPTRPFHHPKPGNNIGQIVPPGKPWPSKPEDYQNFSQIYNPDDFQKKNNSIPQPIPNLEDRIKETTTTISLEYKPMRPSFHPSPGNNVGQVVPPGKPWPSKPEDYQNFSQVYNPDDFQKKNNSIPQPIPNLEDRIKETTTTISLEYKPMRPSFHPSPGNNIGQVVPPGKPWPSKPEDYQNFSQVYNPLDFQKNNHSSGLPSLVVPILNLEDRIKETTTVISLAYKPSRPFYYPKPGNHIGQIVPPGKPWPSKPEDYGNFSQFYKPDTIQKHNNSVVPQSIPNLEDRIKVNSTLESKPGNPVLQSEDGNKESTTVISLEYKPSRPFHHPKPGNNIGQIVPPGKPWPSKPEDENNLVSPSLENEMTTSTTIISVSLEVKPTMAPNRTTITSTSSRPRIEPLPLGRIQNSSTTTTTETSIDLNNQVLIEKIKQIVTNQNTLLLENSTAASNGTAEPWPNKLETGTTSRCIWETETSSENSFGTSPNCEEGTLYTSPP